LYSQVFLWEAPAGPISGPIFGRRLSVFLYLPIQALRESAISGLDDRSRFRTFPSCRDPPFQSLAGRQSFVFLILGGCESPLAERCCLS
jgi:hypothetical protein